MNRHAKSSKACAVATVLTALSLILLPGCGQDGNPKADRPTPSWPQGAIVAELSYAAGANSIPSTLAELAILGFDTVLFDAHVTPPPLLWRHIETAKALQLQVAVDIGSPGDNLPDMAGDPLTLRPQGISHVDGLVLSLQSSADLDDARALQSTLQQAKSNAVLIADLGPPGARPGISLPQGIFAAVLLDDGSAGPLLPTSTRSQHPSGAQGYTEAGTLPQWRRIRHCQPAIDSRCNEDIRRLVTGFMQAAVPVTGVIDGAYWHEVYSSLIALRQSTPWLHEGQLEWYAADAQAPVLAYRLTNDKRQHILVAVNVSEGHEQLPLPSGFMAVSKVRLWTSYDPTIRELVTSKPIVLPARSAVVVIDK